MDRGVITCSRGWESAADADRQCKDAEAAADPPQKFTTLRDERIVVSRYQDRSRSDLPRSSLGVVKRPGIYLVISWNIYVT